MVCSHIETASLNHPSAYTQVYKDECTQCFDSQDGADGIDVCLSCFNGGCLDSTRHHALTHHQLTGHPLAVNIRRITVNQPKRTGDGTPPPQKITKIAIVMENEEPQYEFVTKIRCYACNGAEEAKDATPELNAIVEAVLSSISSAKQSDIKAWEEEITPCEHTLCLVQDEPKKLEQQKLAHCANCELNQNLWLCLQCGNLGCGRKQYDGSGGNNHAIDHFKQTGHGVNVKLGTITAEGTAGIIGRGEFGNGHNDLAAHLATWGINVASQSKTEKSMTELQLEQNMKFDFSMTTEDGKQLQPKFGPGYTGLKNLGNSCYMASVLQSVFNVEAFQDRYYNQLNDHALTCTADPATCWYCQLHKLADGILSGRYSTPQTNEDGVQYQDGIAPGMFKALVGKGHEEFSTMRQQDAFEFYQYLLKTIQQKEHASKNDPTGVFDFLTEQRLQCQKCKKVRYQQDQTNSISVSVPIRPSKSQNEEGKTTYEPVTITECLDDYVKEEIVEGYNCPNCSEKTTASRSVKFKTFPQTLVINPRRFAFINWVPQKLDIPIQFPESLIQLDKYLSQGHQSGEELLPEDESNASAGGESEPSFNQNDIDQLKAMGFSDNRCKRALLNTGHNGAEVAMSWMFEHMEDPDIDDPLPATSNSANNNEPSVDQISTLQDMGFSEAQARKALRETSNNTERALDWLFSHPDDMGDDSNAVAASSATKDVGDSSAPFNYKLDSFVSHKGTSVHCGHYVSHVHKNGEWILFNDNKVAVTPNPPVGEAYLYFLQRQ